MLKKKDAGADPGEWMSVPDAAALKGVAASSVRAAVNRGRLTGAKIGRSYVVLRRDVEAWVIGPRGPKKERTAPHNNA